ncbi:MAG: hypothetical protein J6N70_13260 [Oribacterium sp.]|nr:hypothetical protein [Oribacterium sp.]
MKLIILEIIWKYANSEYHKMETGEPDADKTSRSYVFPAVSIYRALGAPEAVQMICYAD